MKKLIQLIILFAIPQLFAQGSLEVKLKDSSQLKLASLKINVNIVGNFAKTTYDMEFYNELDRTLEGELVFPLAEGQAVSQFAMEVNGKLREAVIVEKELARVAFETTVRQTIDPGLLEKTEGNNYRARVYPILPKAHKRILLTFEQELVKSDKYQTYELPLGLKDILDEFSIQIQVFKSSSTGVPILQNDRYGSFLFEQKEAAYIASVKLHDIIPESSVFVKIPYGKTSNRILSFKDYFFLGQTLNPHTRIKEKPKRITLLWDASYSLQYRNLDKELALLNEYFQYLDEVEVQYISFSNTIHRKTIFKIQNGNWETLKKVIKEVPYDGGTALNLFKKSLMDTSDEVLLFTDGLVNLGGFSFSNKNAIYTVNSTTSANHELLEKIATTSGGNYINLLRLPVKAGTEILKQETFQFLGALHNNAIYEVYPKKRTNVSEDFTISGRFSEESTIELLFGYHGKVTQRIKVPVKRSNETRLVKRLWAKQKLKYLNTDKKENKEQIISLAKSHHLITDFTSMLILDRIEDYVRYRIEPPQELKAEYKERLKNIEDQETENLEELNDRKADIFDDYEEILEWYATKYPKKTPLKQRTRTDRNIQQTQTNQPLERTRSNTSNQVRTVTRANTHMAVVDSTRRYISGNVSDSSGPLPGAIVVIKGTTSGTQTDFDGNFTINANPEDKLLISFIGFKTKEVTMGNGTVLQIQLEEDSSELDEVVITAYGVEPARMATGSIVREVSSQLLSGSTTGVQITQNSGEPGTGANVRVRGSSFISGDNAPLYIVDGVPVTNNPMEKINPEDIEGIQVLKAMSASALYGNRAANGVIIITTKQGMESNHEAIEELDRKIAEKIELRSWNPDTPYLRILEKEPTSKLAYSKYLEIRNDYANSPSFYLDVSDFFDKKGNSDLAITILTNLMEIDLNNYELTKALGYKLEYYGQYALAAIAYEKVLELRPEEPQSYRDLALVYEQTGEIQKSFEMLYQLYSGDLLEKDREERFYGIEHIVFVELNRLVKKYEKKLKLTSTQKLNFKEIPVDIRVVIDWNHNDTDIDLWVEDPLGEKAYYKNQETKIGGRMSEDMTDGYGPEEFMLKSAPGGVYKILVDYYADNVQKISGPTILKVTMFTNYGKPDEKKEIAIVRLDKEEDELEVGSLTFN